MAHSSHETPLQCKVRSPAPLMGQHNREIYGCWLGLSDEELERLVEFSAMGKKVYQSTMIDYRLEHLFSYTATLDAPPEVIGPVPEGFRTNVYVTGGEVSGPILHGRLRPVGGDWLTVRTDGVGILDVRATIETHDGALIYVTYTGVLDLGEDGYQKFLRGELPASGTAIRMSPRCHTSHPTYQWLNRLHCLGIGQAFLERSEVCYDVYAVR